MHKLHLGTKVWPSRQDSTQACILLLLQNVTASAIDWLSSHAVTLWQSFKLPALTWPQSYWKAFRASQREKQVLYKLTCCACTATEQPQADMCCTQLTTQQPHYLQEYKPSARDWLSSYWKGFMSPDQMARIRNTGVPMEFLKEVGCKRC